MTPGERVAIHKSFYERDLLDARNHSFVAGIQIMAPENGVLCSRAAEYVGCYRLEDAPDYPFGSCDNDSCCCWWEVVFDDEDPPGGWKVPVSRHPKAGRAIPHPDPQAEPMNISGEEIMAAHGPWWRRWWRKLFGN